MNLAEYIFNTLGEQGWQDVDRLKALLIGKRIRQARSRPIPFYQEGLNETAVIIGVRPIMGEAETGIKFSWQSPQGIHHIEEFYAWALEFAIELENEL